MTLPGNDPNNLNDQYPNRGPRWRRRRAGGGWWIAWSWIWILFIIAFIWFAGWGWWGYGGWWWGGNSRAAGYGYGYNYGGQRATGSGIQVLTSSDKQAFVGKAFQVNDAVIKDKVNDHVLWVAANNSTPMLVVLTGPGNSTANANIKQGNRVDITGTVEKAPAEAAAKQEWDLPSSGTNRLEQQGAYVQASQVQKIG